MAEHPLYQQRHNQEHWYNTAEMSDLLTLVQAEKLNVASALYWKPDPETGGAKGIGVDYQGGEYDSVDGKSIYILPINSCLTHETAATTSSRILTEWRAANPKAKPKSIVMTLLLEGDHFTTLCVSPDPNNPERADIAYINPLGDLSDGRVRGNYTTAKIAQYARADREVIEAVRGVFREGIKVTINERDLLEDSNSCGPLAVEHMIALGDAENPSELVRAGNLKGQEQVTALREEQGNRMQNVPERLYLLPELYSIFNDNLSDQETLQQIYYFGRKIHHLRHLNDRSPDSWEDGLKDLASSILTNGFRQSLLDEQQACEDGLRKLDEATPITTQDIKRINKLLFPENRITDDQIASSIADQDTLRNKLRAGIEYARDHKLTDEDIPKLVEMTTSFVSAGNDPTYVRTYDDLSAVTRDILKKT